MKKIFIEIIVLITFFFAVWFALAKVDWITIFKVQTINNKTEEKIGDLYWDIIQKTGKENRNSLVTKSIDSIVTKICKSNNIDKNFIKVHILEKDDVNAFALPNGHLVIFSGLILKSNSQEELCGVICHELAHIKLKHIMKKLVKEVGLATVIAMTSSKSGTEVIKSTARLFTSSAFDRNLEKEADISAVDYLVKAKINPEPFANFLYNIAADDNEATEYISWISTHPESKERAEYIIDYSKNKKVANKEIITKGTWEKIKKELEENEETF